MTLMMNQHQTQYIEIKLKPSKFAWVISLSFCLGLVYLLAQSGILSWYKFIVLISLTTTAGLCSYYHWWLDTAKIDLLLHYNTAVIWQQGRPYRTKITRLRSIGSLVIVLGLISPQRSWRIIIFYDSIVPDQFKQLMRYIRWHN